MFSHTGSNSSLSLTGKESTPVLAYGSSLRLQWHLPRLWNLGLSTNIILSLEAPTTIPDIPAQRNENLPTSDALQQEFSNDLEK